MTTTTTPPPEDDPDLDASGFMPSQHNVRHAWPTWRAKARRRRQVRKSKARAAQLRRDRSLERRWSA